MGRFKVAEDNRRIGLGTSISRTLKEQLRELALKREQSLTDIVNEALIDYARKHIKGVK